mmetsp:Transcript_46729/g.82375  ORF Transcript_46729/g.82375 Transcript_46729/m.82375 type:complete len:1167 (-) Transcript_46729:146-3646(-)
MSEYDVQRTMGNPSKNSKAPWLNCLHTSGCVVLVAAVGLISYHFVAVARSAQVQSLPRSQLVQTSNINVQVLKNTPKSDDRKYQYAVLDNGFRVLNVQDKRSLQNAFAVAVEAGSFADPKGRPGLAHFCEHMLFLGTEKYPEPSGFDNFMSANGGANNAYTADEVTVYFAEMSGASAEEGLDRFADFFRAPLFDSKYVSKEVQAIDSEHAKNVQDPQRRVLEVLYALADPESPESRFHTGNAETLYKAPHANGEDPVDALKEYFRLNYCPRRMTLVTIGSADVEEQLLEAKTKFGNISEGHEGCDSKKPSFANPEPFPAARMGQVVNIQGSLPQAELWLHFALPDLSEAYKNQPLQYLEYVLSYGGTNSLSRVLQDNLGLVTSLQTMYDMNSAGTNMLMMMRLTNAGNKHVKLICSVIYGYLAKLRRDGVNKELYDSIARSTHLKWDWAETSGPSDTASTLAERMTRLPKDQLLSGDSLIDELDDKLVMSLIEKLTPGNMNLVFVDPAMKNGTSNLDGKATEMKKLRYYGVEYSVQRLAEVFPDSPNTWEQWLTGEVDADGVAKALKTETNAASKMDVAGGGFKDSSIVQLTVTGTSSAAPPGPIEGVPNEVPLENMKVTSGLKAGDSQDELFGPRPAQASARLLGLSKKGKVKKQNFLQEKLESSLSQSESITGNLPPEVWYRRGWVTTSPKAQLQLLLRPPRATTDPEVSALDSVRLSLYSRLLAEEMEPKMVDLMAVGISYGIDVSPHGLTFTFSGFTPVMPLLIEKVLGEFNAFNGNASIMPSRYQRITQELREELATFSEMPIQYAIQDRNLLITKGPHSRAESLKALDKASLESVSSAVGEVLLSRPLQLTALAMGNMAENEATETIVNFVGQVRRPGGVQLSSTGGEVERVTRVVDLADPVEVRRQNPRVGDPNDAVVVSMMSGVSSVGRRVRLAILGQILSPVAYNELRTRRQLGYVVSAGTAQVSNVQYVSCVVQGNALGADDMEVAIEHVLHTLMPQRLQNMTEKEFNSYKESFRQELLQPPVRFQDEMSHYWGPVSQGGRCFDLRDRMLQYLNTSLASKDALVEEWSRLMTPKADGVRKKVVVKLFANKVPPRRTEQNITAAWSKQGLSKDTIELLQREHQRSTVLDNADASTREQLVHTGGYYSTDLRCEENEE